MSTRSRAKTGISSKGSSAGQSRQKSRSVSQKHHDDMDIDSLDETDDVKISAKRKGKVKQEKPRAPLRSIDCICAKGDDGSPMIQCSECKIWYHFTCVDLSEPEAEEINIYICPTCTTSTRLRSTMNWEGDAANEECVDDDVTISTRRKAALSKSRDGQRLSEMAEESEESSSSEDDYIDVKREHVEQSKTVSKRTSTASDSDSEDRNRKRRFTRKVSASPVTNVQNSTLKRKAAPHSNPVQASPAHKRKRSTESHGNTAADDPARKYCLGKLEALFRDVFLRYPHLPIQPESSAAGQSMEVREDSNEVTNLVPKDPESLTEEEKETVLNGARQFANELESSVFEIYAEPDKNGNPHAGGKYKERFRMLQFNLSKVDRVVIHQRITSGNISAKEISLMSSTDLADEETKQSIKLAEKEALEHSILLKTSAPRAKITHKGLQDIEDVNGEVATAQQIERLKEREQEEDERRERERMARLRTVQRQRTASISVPPESPIVPSREYQWGAPPPVPSHAMSPTAAESEEAHGQSTRPSLFLQTPEVNNVEPELNLDDLINIDGEQESPRPSPVQESTNSISTDTKLEALPTTHPSPVVPTPTGISPFASRPERMRGASFDLSSIWNAPKDDAPPTSEPAQQVVSVSASTPVGESPAEGSDKDDAMELESVEANDQDFDMFLEDNRVESPSDDLIVTPIPSLQDVESLPQVWTGKLAMPLDSSMPQETYLVARQVAGRGIPPESPLWRTLFPSDQLRIEGRVPVDNSTRYLMQMRLNASKELYAAAFVPASSANVEDFKTFCNFLKSKSRHGLVFPWGNRTKDYHPGRELYMIPLLQSEPLPEFVELLDGLKLPTTRTKDYLLGIWILNKGKLAVLPSAATAPPAPQQTPPPISMPPTQLPPVSMPPVQPPQHIPRIPVIPPPMFNTPPPHVPQNLPVPTPPLSLPQTIPGMPAIAPAALAAEVASLTPEQLQEVLRTLAATTQIPLPPPTGHIPQPPPSQPPFSQNRPSFPPHAPPHIPPGVQNTQPWMHHPPPPPPPPPGQYPVNYPPPNVPYQQPPRGSNSPAPVMYDRHDYEHDYRPGPHHSHGGRGGRGGHDDRGWRGNQSNRGGPGRGRGRAENHDRDHNGRRSSDSGWPRRRNDSQGGPW